MLLALVAFTACSTDRDDNPTLVIPADGSFALYAPGITANTIDLDNSTAMTFQVDQPDYGYTAAITYMMEFAVSEDGSTWSEWQLTETSNENPLAITLSASEIAGAVTTGLVELGRSEADFPLTAFVKARVRAFLPGLEESSTIYSTETQFKVTTSYTLPPVPASLFYIVGAQPGWSADAAISAVMFPEGGDVYTYTTKFTGAWDLKMWYVDDLGVWEKCYGTETDGDNSPAGNIINENAQAISSPTAEFYTFTFDKQHMTYTWTLLDNQAPTEYTSMWVVGGFNDWPSDSGVAMTQVTPHNWYVQATIGADTELKFRANDNWDVNWGATDFAPTLENFSAIGENNGPNIVVAAGQYRFYLNDITGAICIVPVQ